ncbi:hypothetical protein BSL78_09634, partial [Apostichopus japonicus]
SSILLCLSLIAMWVMSASGHQTANILMVFEQPGTSHFKSAAAVARVLSSRGYNITFILPEPYHTYPAASQYRDIFSFLHIRKGCSRKSLIVDTEQLAQDVTIESDSTSLLFQLIKAVADDFLKSSEDLLCDVELNDEIMSSRFDLIMTDANFLWQQVLVQKMPDIPHGLISTTAASSLTNSWIRAPNLPSILPGFMIRTHHRKPLSFFWRTYNTVFIYGAVIFFSAVLDPLMGVVTSSYSSSVSHYPTITFGLSDIWLTNADFTTDTPRPFLPNMVLVGGLNIEEPEPLSEEYQVIFDNAGAEGVLVVSMGTVVDGVSQEQADAMSASFARLPQIIIWKEPNPPPRVIGNNTYLKKWIPQKDLVAHPKTRALVYHCGNNGAFEALYHGVPIIGIPIFADQTDVAYRMMSTGMGLVIELSTLTNETLYQVTAEVLNNPKYRERAQYLSAVYRDNTVTAPERGAFWVEYILRHRGNRLMRAKVTEMGIIQEYLLDVWLFSVVLIYIIMKCLQWLFGACFR